jgi:hypothetical protein
VSPALTRRALYGACDYGAGFANAGRLRNFLNAIPENKNFLIFPQLDD